MPSIRPTIIIGIEDFQDAINYHLYYDGDLLKLAQKFVISEIEANKTLTRQEIREITERKINLFSGYANHILEELF